MSNDETTEAVEASESQSDVPAQEETEIDWKAQARKWETRAKEANKELERLSELEKQLEEAKETSTKEIAAREEAIEKANLEILRLSVANKYGISEEDRELFLTGSDEELLEKQAQRISERTSAPKPDPTQGKRNGPGTPSNQDAFALAVEGVL